MRRVRSDAKAQGGGGLCKSGAVQPNCTNVRDITTKLKVGVGLHGDGCARRCTRQGKQVLLSPKAGSFADQYGVID